MITNYLDAIIVITLLLMCILIGLIKVKFVRTFQEFVEFKNIGLNALVCTLISASLGVGITMGISEKIFLFGFAYLILLLFQPLGWITSLYVISPGIENFKGCVTIGDIMHKSYGKNGRIITCVLSLLNSIGAFAMQITAVGYLLNFFFNTPTIYGSIFGTFVFVIYSLFGGMKSVIYTETFKVIIFGFVFPISCGVAIYHGSNIENFIESIESSYNDFELSFDNVFLLISFLLFSIVPPYNPDLVQRYLLAKNAKQLSKAFKILFALTTFAAVSVGAITYIVISTGYSGSAKEIFPYFITNLLPHGLQGLMIAGIIAIFISKAESDISAASTIIINDFLKRLSPNLSGEKQLSYMRFVMIMLSCLSLLFLYLSNNILDIILFVRNFWEPIILIPLVSSFLGFKTHKKTFLYNTIFAFSFLIFGRIYAGEFATISYSFGILGSVIGFFGSHYLQHSYFPFSNSFTKFSLNTIKVKNIYNYLTQKFEKNDKDKYKVSEFIAINCVITFACLVGCTHFVNPITMLFVACLSYTLSFVMIFKEYIPYLQNSKMFNVYWFLSLIFCLPFTAGCFMFFCRGNDFWILTSVFITFVLSYFVDSTKFIFFTIIGLISAYFVYFQTSPYHKIDILNISYLYITTIIFALFFIKSREMEREIKFETMKIFSSAIAHEMKNPLSSVIMSAQAITKILSKTEPQIVGDRVTIKRTDFDFLKYVSTSLEEMSHNTVSTVNNLLLNVRDNMSCKDKCKHKISDVISEAIKEFPKENKIIVKINDNFEFTGRFNNIKHLILNLLNNAHKHGGKEVKIKILTENNKLYFRDNGKGMSHKEISKAFKSFYSRNKNGSGIGLAFCKMVIEDMGGSIECNSLEGEYTEFIVSFT